jgi:hypothetical protein
MDRAQDSRRVDAHDAEPAALLVRKRVTLRPVRTCDDVLAELLALGASERVAEAGHERMTASLSQLVCLLCRIGNESLPLLPAHPKGDVTDAGPIRVYVRDGKWLVDYGSYVHESYGSRGEAIRVGTHAAFVERRELKVEGELPLGERQGQAEA